MQNSSLLTVAGLFRLGVKVGLAVVIGKGGFAIGVAIA
ncbi:hypothetical protein JCM19233_247 [Vibrio astriarenae]|nr:hypothetical protein JCM19233_247 [Vibrio sp. C7]